MASVTIKRGTEAEVASTAITDGQILFTTDREYNNQIMADVGEDRILIGGNNVFTGTQAEYEEALSLGLIFEGMQVNITDDYNRDLDADVIVYDNTTSGLDSTTVQGAIDEIDSNVDTLDGRMDSAETQVGNSYKTTDTSDTTIASADKIPFYDESATSKKNITLDDFVDTIAPNFGSQVSISQGNTLDLLDKDGSLLDSVTIETKATNVSYTDTNSIGETDVQGALDYVTDSLDWKYLGSVQGNTQMNYPATWQELWIQCVGQDTTWQNYDFTVLKEFINNPNRPANSAFRNGFYVSNIDYGDCVLIATATSIYISSFRVGGTDQTTNAVMRVYYR